MTTSNNTRRILVPIRYPLGGIRTYILYNYPFLAEAGYRFTFVGPADEMFRAFAKDVASWEGVEIEEVPVVQRKCKLRPAVRRLLKTRRFQLVHSQGLGSAVYATLANLGIGVPHVTTSHGLIVDRDFPGIKGKCKLAIVNRILSRVDIVVAVSNDARDNHLQRLSTLRRKPQKCITIFNGIEVARFSAVDRSATGTLREDLGIGDDVFLIGYLGRFMPEKGFPVLVDALELLQRQQPERKFHVAAFGEGDYIREYRADVNSRPSVGSRVTFCDLVSDVPKVLSQLDLLVVPSLWEACPLLPMEAMCAGVAIIGTNAPGLREVLRDTPSLMVPSGDPKALADGISQTMADSQRSVAHEYAPIAQKRFTVKHSANALRTLCDTLAEH